MEKIIRKSRSQSLTNSSQLINESLTKTLYYKKMFIFKPFDTKNRIKPGSFSLANSTRLISESLTKTRGFEVSYETPTPGVLIIKNGNAKRKNGRKMLYM